jgi:2-phospho-L-lactate guanylyltransferase
VLVVTDDRRVGAELAPLGARIMADPPAGGLNAAFARGAATAEGWRAALTADLPALRPAELAAALAAAGRTVPATAPSTAGPSGAAGPRHGPPPGRVRRFVADAPGSGTVLLTAPPGVSLDPRFGPGSAAAHARSGALALDGPWPSLRRDEDTPVDLRLAAGLGLGRRTAALVAGRLPAVGGPASATGQPTGAV